MKQGLQYTSSQDFYGLHDNLSPEFFHGTRPNLAECLLGYMPI